MEGATVASLPSYAGTDPVAGYGTHITGPLPGTNGFDASPLNDYSVKYHNGTTWVGTGMRGRSRCRRQRHRVIVLHCLDAS